VRGRGAPETREQLGEDYPAFLLWASMLPLHLRTEAYLALHGACEPGVPLRDQRVEVLTGTGAGMRSLRAGRGWAVTYEGDVPIVFGHSPVGRSPRWVGPRALGIDTGA